MRRTYLLFAALITISSIAQAQHSTHIRGYTRKSTGTYVAPHRRTTPDHSWIIGAVKAT